MLSDLKPIYDSCKSFYGKARIKKEISGDDTNYILISYSTTVARVVVESDKTIYYYGGRYSNTTTRHQKEFYKQFGLSDEEIKELIKNTVLEVQNKKNAN